VKGLELLILIVAISTVKKRHKFSAGLRMNQAEYSKQQVSPTIVCCCLQVKRHCYSFLQQEQIITAKLSFLSTVLIVGPAHIGR